MRFYVYVLLSEKTGRRYVGSCADLDDRLTRHNAGHSKATKHGIPWRLVYFEEYTSRSDAVRRVVASMRVITNVWPHLDCVAGSPDDNYGATLGRAAGFDCAQGYQ